MLLRNAIVAAVCGGTLASLPAFAQEDPLKADIGFETSVPLVEDANAHGARQSVSANYGSPSAYRWFFNEHSRVALSYDYPHNTQWSGLNNGSTGTKSNSDIFQFPTKRWSLVPLTV